MKRLLLSSIVLLATACGDGNTNSSPDMALPPAICKTPTPVQPGQPWFTEITDQAKLGGVIGVSVRGADLDGDGYPDLVAATLAVPRQTDDKPQRFLLMNRPDPADPAKRIFVDTTKSSGILATRDGMGGRSFATANLGDVDNDGHTDVVVCPGSDMAPDPCAAYLNDGTGKFTFAPMSELEGIDVFQCDSAALLDWNRDGNLDFWPATFGVAPFLLQGSGDGRFKNITDKVGLPLVDGDPAQHLSYRRTFGVTACDLDGDGDQDILLADYGREHNQVWRNDGDHLTEIGELLGVAADDRMDFSDDQSYRCFCQANPAQCPMSIPPPLPGICPDRGWVPGQSDQPWRLGGNNFSIACGDLDDDGDMDLMTATIRHWDVGSASDPSEILRNDTPPGAPLMKFTRPGNAAMGLDRSSVEKGSWDEGDMMPVFADLDLDGRKDIYLTSSDYPGDHGWLWHQKADHTFEDVSATSGGGQKEPHGVALLDIDGDGDLDLVLGTSVARGVATTQAVRLYRNDVGQASNWIQVHLTGLGAGHSNRSAIGARVAVTAGGKTQVQEVSGGYGHVSMQHDLVLTFGLGAACAVDQIEVRWPDAAGTKQVFKDPRANYRVEITEGAPSVSYLRR